MATKNERRRRTKQIAQGKGFFLVISPKPGWMRSVTRDMPALVTMMGGVETAAAFVAAFEATDRMTSYVHLMELNDAIRETRVLAWERNHRVLAFSYMSTFSEFWKALFDQIKSIDKVAGHSRSWRELRSRLLIWEKDVSPKTIRNTFGFHLGIKEIKVGLAGFKAGNEVEILRADGPDVFDSSWSIGLRLIFKGSDFDDAQFIEAIVKIRDQSIETKNLVQQVFADILVGNGVRMKAD
jgi:hypothetical protein